MTLRQEFFFYDSAAGDGSNYFLIPSDCYCVWVTMVGGGANGRGLGSAAGKDGGSSAWPIVRYPLAVKPNGVLAVVVGRGGLAATGGTNPETDAFNSVALSSIIAGDIYDPMCLKPIPVFSAGYAGGTSNDMVIDCRVQLNLQLGSNANLTFNNVSNMPWNLVGAAMSREGGAPASRSAGKCVGNDKGLGPMATGGSGGANIFGIGGEGGTSGINGGLGNDGIGYGSGGGGGCDSAYGGDGAPGFVLLEY